MFKKIVSTALIFLQLTLPTVSYAEANLHVGEYHPSPGLLVFSDGDPGTFDPSNAQSQVLIDNYRRVFNETLSKPKLSYQDMVRYANALRPFVSYLENSQRIANGGALTIPPGQNIVIKASTYCLDNTYSPPVATNPLMLVNKSTVIPPKAMPIYDALIKHGAAVPDDWLKVQQGIHAIKDMATLQSDKNNQSILNFVPNATNLVNDYYASLANKKNHMPTVQASQKNWSDTTPLNNGLKISAPGSDGNARNAVIFADNTGNSQPAKLKLQELVAVPKPIANDPRPYQRLAVGGVATIFNGNLPVMQVKANQLFETLVQDAGVMLGTKTADFSVKSINYAVKNPAVRTLLSSAPIASTMIAAWELYTGVDFFTGNDMNPAEKMMAALNLVPSAAFMSKALGASAAVIERAVLADSTLNAVRDVGDFATLNSSQYMAGEIYNATIDNSQIESATRAAMVAYANSPSTPDSIRQLINSGLATS